MRKVQVALTVSTYSASWLGAEESNFTNELNI